MKKFQTEILIEVPAEKVWTILMDFTNYWHWNTHLPYWEGKPKLGNHFYITSFLQEKPVRFSAQVTSLVENKVFAFHEVVVSASIFKADHSIEIRPVSPSSCLVVQQECLAGLLVRLVWKKWMDKASQCYSQMNHDLKQYAESQYTLQKAKTRKKTAA